jgi:hypothetical protein
MDSLSQSKSLSPRGSPSSSSFTRVSPRRSIPVSVSPIEKALGIKRDEMTVKELKELDNVLSKYDNDEEYVADLISEYSGPEDVMDMITKESRTSEKLLENEVTPYGDTTLPRSPMKLIDESPSAYTTDYSDGKTMNNLFRTPSRSYSRSPRSYRSVIGLANLPSNRNVPMVRRSPRSQMSSKSGVIRCKSMAERVSYSPRPVNSPRGMRSPASSTPYVSPSRSPRGNTSQMSNKSGVIRGPRSPRGSQANVNPYGSNSMQNRSRVRSPRTSDANLSIVDTPRVSTSPRIVTSPRFYVSQ